MQATPRFFRNALSFRKWLEAHHLKEQELLVGYYKKDTGRASMTWSESVDQALCFGWIDGIRRTIDDVSYSIRFTPRKPKSVWSQVNIDKVQELVRQNLMQPAGLAAFAKRVENRSGIYSYEQRGIELEEPYRSEFHQDRVAWRFFSDQPKSYRKAACWWVLSAKRETTRRERLAKLIEHSRGRERIPQFARPSAADKPSPRGKRRP